jgi:SAM-dependent methyltransferase
VTRSASGPARAKDLARQICPPILWSVASSIKRSRGTSQNAQRQALPETQDLSAYWDPEFATMLDHWGEGTVWVEIALLMWGYEGKVLDIACGTGKTMELLNPFPRLDVYGCDISDLLIKKAAERGIREDHLEVCDATRTDYDGDQFDYSYSIGSLEHFTEEGIGKFLVECKRITHRYSFHQIPVSATGREEGWVNDGRQSFFNNPVDWWMQWFTAAYPTVLVLDSGWRSQMSLGKWFICVK